MPITAKDFLQTLPNGQTPEQEKLYGFIPGGWLPDWVKQGYNQSIEGMAQQVMRGSPVFSTDKNYDPNMLADIGATVVSFLTPTDFATMALGGGIGGVALKKIAAKKLAQAKLKPELAEMAVEKGSQYVFSQAKDKAVMGATGLGFYSGLQSSLGQKVTTGDVDLVAALKDATIGATLGAATGGVGTKVGQFAKSKGYSPLQVKTLEKTSEVGVFGTGGPLLEGELPSFESYIHAAGVIGGISLSRALKNKIINPPKQMLEGAELERAYAENAEALAQSAAKERRGKEVWKNEADGREVKILTDWTRSRSREDFFLLEDLKGSQFKELKENFFDEWYRFKDSKGNDAQNKLQKKTFYDLKKNLKLGDLDIKNMVDKVSGKEGGFKLKEHKDPGREYHTNYDKLSPKQKNILYEKVQENIFIEKQKNEFKKQGIEIADMSGSSLLKESAPAIYNIIQGVKPLASRLPDIPIVRTIKKQIFDLEWRMAELSNKGMQSLANATYITRDGKRIKGLHKLNDKEAIEFYEDMKSSDPMARKRISEYRKITDYLYDTSGKAGIKLAPKEKDYISQIPKKSFIRNVQKDLETFLNKSDRMLNNKLSSQSDVEIHLKRAIENNTKELSESTKDAMVWIMEQNNLKSYAKAFQTVRDEVLTKYVSSNKNLEVARKENKLPPQFYENDGRAILGNYVANWAKSVAMNEVSGADGSKVYNNIDAFQDKFKMYKEAELLRKAFDSYTGKIEIDPRYNWSHTSKKLLNDIVNFEVATKIGLGFATIPNLTQVFISSVLKRGYAPFFSGTYKMLTDKNYRKEIRSNTGAGSLELHQMIVGLDPMGISWTSKVADKITTLSGFKHINRLNSLISSYTAYEAALKLQKTATSSKVKARRNWAIKSLTDMGITDIGKKITPESASRLMYEFARDTQLQKNVFREPAFANDPQFRPFFLFKRFGYRQFQWIGSELKKEVKGGNVVFPLRLAAAGMAGGYFIGAAKRFLSDLLSGEDVYDENYKYGKDQIGLNDIIDNFASVGAFGLVSDIMASENTWQSLEFAVKPAVAQDAMKAYSALQKIITDSKDFGLGFHTMQRSLKNIVPIFGTIPRRIAQQFETTGQRESYVKFRYSKIHPRILDYMIDGNSRMAQRLIREWNGSFPERPIMYDDIGPKAINRRLENKYKKRMNP